MLKTMTEAAENDKIPIDSVDEDRKAPRALHEEWVEENPVEEVVIAQEDSDGYVIGEQHVDHIIEQDMNMEYDDNFPSLLPVRDGVPLLSLNLPDLLSKPITFMNGIKMTLCFNKKCLKQVALDGYLYTIEGYVSDTSWNTWKCVNSLCPGSIRTSGNWEELRVRCEHDAQCFPDDAQIRLRIAIYDLRLMAEFTDLSLEVLYEGCENRMKTEHSDIYDLFPSFEALKGTLEDHRVNKIYRKRFEMQTLKDKQKKMHMTPDEVVYAESTAGMIRFKRTKPFPVTVCFICDDHLQSNTLPSQDQLISHLLYTHEKQMLIERFVFKEVNLFEQYLRELNVFGKHRFKKFGLADENMYYLCQNDFRVSKNSSTRAKNFSQSPLHCTAFIRVFDWRHIMKRQSEKVVIDYTLEHSCYDGGSKNEYEYFSPEDFVREIEERRMRTQKILEDNGMNRMKRPIEVRSIPPSARMKPSFGSRSLAPPIAAQLAGGNTQPYVDGFYSNEELLESRLKFKQSIRPVVIGKGKSESSSSSNNQQSSSTQNTDNSLLLHMSSLSSSKRGLMSRDRRRITDRTNFKDIYTFNAVNKIEDVVMALLRRLQMCQSSRVAVGYKDKLMAIYRKANTDRSLSSSADKNDIENSWVLLKATRGRPRKTNKAVERNEDSIFDDEEEEGDTRNKSEEVLEDGEVPASTMVSQEVIPEVVEELIVKSEITADIMREESQSPKKGKSRKLENQEDESSKRPRMESESDKDNNQNAGEPTRSGRLRKVPARLVE